MRLVNYEVKQVDSLIGAKIVSAIVDADSEYFGFRVKKGKKFINVWVNMDPEGNGPGHLNIEPE